MSDYLSMKYQIKRGFIFFALLVVAALATFTLFIYQPPQYTSDTNLLKGGLAVNQSSLEEMRLNQQVASGKLLFMAESTVATEANEEINLSGLHEYDLATRYSGLSLALPTTALANGQEIGVFVSGEDESSADHVHLGFYNEPTNELNFARLPSLWNESYPVVNPAGTKFAYTAQQTKGAADSPAWLASASWSVVAVDIEDGSYTSYNDAFSPQWLGDDLVVLSSDGVYRIDITTGETTQVVEGWRDITKDSELQVSRDSVYAVLTVPSLGSIVVYTITETGEFIQDSFIANAGVTYTNPVFAPDNAHYALLAYRDEDYVAGTDTYTQAYVEIRSTAAADVLFSQAVPYEVEKGVTLFDWR